MLLDYHPKIMFAFRNKIIFHLLQYVLRVLQTFTLDTQKYIAYAECHLIKLHMIHELGSEVSINLLDSVLDNVKEVCSFV